MKQKKSIKKRIKTKSKTKTKSKLKPKPKIKTKTKVKSKTKPKIKPKIKPRAKAKIKPGTKNIRKPRRKTKGFQKLLANLKKIITVYYHRYRGYRHRVPVTAVCLCLLWFYSCPERTMIPVMGARPYHWISDYFWECPWCTRYSKHMGIDIIKDEGTPVMASTPGIILYQGWLGKYGKAIILMSPKVRFHLYGHLNRYVYSRNPFVARGAVIGYVGSTGLSDLPHLHYSIFSFLPNLWRFELSSMGWLKMFVLHPDDVMDLD